MANTQHLSSLIILLICKTSVQQQGQTPAVHTHYGTIHGMQVSPPASQFMTPVVQYLGIPYGAAPVGDKRFMYPTTSARWTHRAKEAYTLPKVCTQQKQDLSRNEALKKMTPLRYDYIKRLNHNLKDESEDCLYMNLYVPVRFGNSLDPLKVLVIIHGDEYSWGAGNPYNGTVLASYGQIIVVTLNYRLGVFGFLSGCEIACPDCAPNCLGNWGLSDIVSALTMLQKILPQFGGDPEFITLMGWGSGAAGVNLLMASPMTSPGNKRQFQRAILLSGSALSSWAMVANPQRYFFELAEGLGCYTKQSKNRPKQFEHIKTDSIFSCIRDHSVENITNAAGRIEVPSFLTAFGPVVDGTVIANYPKHNLEKHGALFRDLDLLIGLTTNDAYNLLSKRDIDQGISLDRRDKIFRTLTRNLFHYHRTEIFDALINEYTDWTNPGDKPFSIRDGVLNALGDSMFAAPAIKTAQLHASGQTPRSSFSRNTFLYVFSHRTETWNRGGAPHDSGHLSGAVNGEDVAYILGYPLWDPDRARDNPYQKFGMDDAQISRVMMRYVSNFVRSGIPTRPTPIDRDTTITQRYEAMQWPVYEESSRFPHLEIAKRPRIGHYYRADKAAFWNSFLPALVKAGRQSAATLPEEHHHLPDHFAKDRYFGTVQPYDGYANMPFPPPPMSPTPPPKDMPDVTTSKPDAKPKPTETPTVVPGGDYSTVLSVTVAVGCALLVLNLLIFAGIYHQRDKQKRSGKKMQLHYHSYDTAQGSTALGTAGAFSLNSPITTASSMMPPAPPPPISTHQAAPNPNNHTLDGDVMSASGMRTFGAGHQHHAGAMVTTAARSYPEQEPLLSTAMAGRQGISPTCPRHGRAALAMAVQQQPSVEEIQV